MERKFKTDTLAFKLDDVSNLLSIFRKDTYFMHESTYYQIVSNPFFDLDSKEVHLKVRYEDYDHYFNSL